MEFFIIFLMTLTLGLRWLTTLKMRQWQAALHRGEEDFQVLKEQFREVGEENRRLQRVRRQYSLRRTNLSAGIGFLHEEMEELRLKARRRVAA